MIWHTYDPCAAYHVAFHGVQAINSEDIDDSRDGMTNDLYYKRNYAIHSTDRDTMKGLLEFWRRRI